MTDTRLGYGIGERVEVTQPIDLEPYTRLQAGERGTVVDTAGEIEDGTTIKLDRFHVGLCEWGNTAYLVDDDLSRIKAVEYTTPVGYVKERVKDWAMRLPEGAWRRISAGALAAIVMMVGVEIAMAHAKHIPSTFISFVERTTL